VWNVNTTGVRAFEHLIAPETDSDPTSTDDDNEMSPVYEDGSLAFRTLRHIRDSVSHKAVTNRPLGMWESMRMNDNKQQTCTDLFSRDLVCGWISPAWAMGMGQFTRLLYSVTLQARFQSIGMLHIPLPRSTHTDFIQQGSLPWTMN
jgi:hypothetical protein